MEKIDAATRRAVSDVLRHLAHPGRLRCNRLAAPYFAGATAVAQSEVAARAVRRIESVVDAARKVLTPRQCEIVERCDLGGELHADVMRRLTISQSHFYRERQRAIEVIGRHLIAGAREPAERIRVLPDAFDVALVEASTLEQVGRYHDAIATLERAATDSGDAERRMTAYCRLVETCSSAGLRVEATQHAKAARAVASATLDDVLAVECDAVAAIAERCAGEEVAAEALALRMLVPLRSAVNSHNRTSTREMFVSMATLLADRAIEHGDPKQAIALCDEANAMLDHTRSRPLLRFQIAHLRASAGIFVPSTALQSTVELERLIAEALEAGQIVEAGSMTASLASTQRLFGHPERILGPLRPMLEVARRCCSGEGRGGALIELACAYIRTGYPAEAYIFLEEIRRDATVGAFIHAYSFVLEAEGALRSGKPGRALDASHEAIERMMLLGRLRFVGAALRFRALALEMLGDRAGALHTIVESLERLQAFGNPRATLRARVDVARLSGDEQRARMLARDLLRKQ